MSRRYFGTDGVRGIANQGLTPELAFRIGQATGRFIRESGLPPRAAIGRDTRRSGPMLGGALAAGLCSAGVDVLALGIAPTPAVSYVVRTGDFGFGAVISASHNPAPDNGIKLLGGDGGKVPDEHELEIERLMDADFSDRPVGAQVGWLESCPKALEAYEDWLVSLVPERLDGMRLVVDGAHGAAFDLAPRVLQRLGAEVASTGVDPDGMNINADGGATKPSTVQKLTLELGAHAGISFDGDADRCIFSDNQGRLVNGDRTIALWASHWRDHGELHTPVVVGTVMSNQGFEAFLHEHGIRLERARVGDKYVAERIRATNAPVGGEQSGHLIFPNHGPTGDGLVTMLEMLRVVVREGKPFAELFDRYENWPQVLLNVAVQDRSTWETEAVREAIQAAESELGARGRVNVRASGTQPVVRIMVEADAYDRRDAVAERLLAVLSQESGGHLESRTDLTHDLGD